MNYNEIMTSLLETDAHARYPFLDPALLAQFRQRHSGGAYACRFARCARQYDGFDTASARQAHERSHQSRIMCAEPACPYSLGIGFGTAAGLRKHVRNYHHGTPVLPPSFQVPEGSGSDEQKPVTNLDSDKIVKRLYQEVNTKKGAPVQQDAKAVQEILPILRKIFKVYQQIDKVFSTALRLPAFSEDRIKKLMEAKVMVFHNWNPEQDCAKGPLSMNLQQAKYAQGLVAEFLRDLQQARGQWHQNQAQQATIQSQQQQTATEGQG